jgi:hypothetical protein
VVRTIRRSRHETQAGAHHASDAAPRGCGTTSENSRSGYQACIGAVLSGLGVRKTITVADADPTARSLIAACSAWVPGARVEDHRPGGRTFSSDPALACRCSRGPHPTPPGPPLGAWLAANPHVQFHFTPIGSSLARSDRGMVLRYHSPGHQPGHVQLDQGPDQADPRLHRTPEHRSQAVRVGRHRRRDLGQGPHRPDQHQEVGRQQREVELSGSRSTRNRAPSTINDYLASGELFREWW